MENFKWFFILGIPFLWDYILFKMKNRWKSPPHPHVSSSLLFCQRARPMKLHFCGILLTSIITKIKREGCLLPQKFSKINQPSYSCSIFFTLVVTPGSESDRRRAAPAKNFPTKSNMSLCFKCVICWNRCSAYSLNKQTNKKMERWHLSGITFNRD